MFPQGTVSLVPKRKTFGLPPGTDDFLFASMAGAPFFRMFARSGQTFTEMGGLPVAMTANVPSTAHHPTEPLLALAAPTTPKLHLYNVSPTGVLTVSDVTVPSQSNTGNHLKWSPDGNYLAVASDTTPWIIVYAFDKVARTLTKLANPATMPGSAMRQLAWNPTSDCIVIVGSGTSSQTMRLYGISDTTITHRNTSSNQQQVYNLAMRKTEDRFVAGWGTASPWARHYIINSPTNNAMLHQNTLQPIPAAGAQTASTDWSFGDDLLLMASNTSINVQRWNGAAWDTAVAQVIGRAIVRARWCRDDLILVSTSTAPYTELWSWNGSALNKLDTPPNIVGGFATDFEFSPEL